MSPVLAHLSPSAIRRPAGGILRRSLATCARQTTLWGMSIRWPAPLLWRSSSLHDRVFGEDLLGSLERLVDCRLRRHPVGHDIYHRQGEHMFGADPRHCGVEHLV